MVAGSFLAVVMRSEGLSVESLAQRCSVTPKSFVNQQHRGFPFARLRWKIEAALGMRAVWSSGAEIEMRRRCREIFGMDPRLISLKELQALCRRVGLQPPGIRQREHWYQGLEAWLAVHQADTEKTIGQKG